MYDLDLLYVDANLEEDRLPGVEPGNAVRIALDAFAEPFRGRVVWVNKSTGAQFTSTGAQFSLMPRNVVSGEFTRVVQRVPVRIQIEREDRWPRLRAGLSATVAIAAMSARAQVPSKVESPREAPGPAPEEADADVTCLFRSEATGIAILGPYRRKDSRGLHPRTVVGTVVMGPPQCPISVRASHP